MKYFCLLFRNYSALVEKMSTGIQCTTCGVRFDDIAKSSDHLDWHFRQNKKKKETSNVAKNRGWYLSKNVSIIFNFYFGFHTVN